MGNASGKLADVVLYRNAGAQVARLRVRKPKNPRTEAQLIQRVIQATAAKAYSLLQPICNHAFEGKSTNTENQSEFMRLNVARDRYRVKVAPMGWRALSQFNSRDLIEPIANNYIVSSGSLPEIPFGGDMNEFIIGQGSGITVGASYGSVAAALGLKQGDQITIMAVGISGNAGQMGNLHVARIILDPSDHDMNNGFVGDGGKINKPNEKNEGNLSVIIEDNALKIDTGWGTSAGTVIASRYEGKWLRSTARLFVSGQITTPVTLGEAVDSWKTEVSSDKYLNQAEV